MTRASYLWPALRVVLVVLWHRSAGLRLVVDGAGALTPAARGRLVRALRDVATGAWACAWVAAFWGGARGAVACVVLGPVALVALATADAVDMRAP